MDKRPRRLNPEQTLNGMSPRDYARTHAEQGLASLAQAVNIYKNVDLPYRYARPALQQFQE
jgi:hypothetical protein